MNNKVFALIAMFLASSVKASDCDIARVVAREIFSDYIKSVKSYEPELSESEFSTWSIGVVVYDLDGDGEKEVLHSSCANHERMGWYWGVAKIDNDNQVNYVEFAEQEPCYYRPERMYILERKGNSKELITNDSILKIENGLFYVRPHGKSIEEIVAQEDFISLSPVIIESFSGSELKHSCTSYIAPELNANAKFDFDIEYAVYLDANNDGFQDAYVSSESDRVTGDKYRWRLYLNNGEKMIPATERIFFRRCDNAPPEILDPDEIARKDAFYHVTYMFGKPAIRIMDYENGNLLCHSYEKLLKRNEKRARPTRDPNEKGYWWGDICNWEVAVEKRLGHFKPLDFDDFIFTSLFVRLERIPCVEAHAK